MNGDNSTLIVEDFLEAMKAMPVPRPLIDEIHFGSERVFNDFKESIHHKLGDRAKYIFNPGVPCRLNKFFQPNEIWISYSDGSLLRVT